MLVITSNNSFTVTGKSEAMLVRGRQISTEEQNMTVQYYQNTYRNVFDQTLRLCKHINHIFIWLWRKNNTV